MRAQSPDLLYQRRARSVKARMTELNEKVLKFSLSLSLALFRF